MTRYELLFQSLKQYFARSAAFEQRGKEAIEAVLRGFAQYLEAPLDACRVCRIGDGLDENKEYPPGQLAELRPDGKFVGCLTVREAPASFLRFAFYVRVVGASFALQSGDAENGKEFLVATLDASALSEFYEHAFSQARVLLETSPEQIASGQVKRPIGFIHIG
jgi:hypothetical protein